MLRRLAIGLVALAVVACVGLLSAYAFLQSEAGRAQLVELLNRRLAAESGSGLRIGRIGGDLSRRVEIHDLSLFDADGVWLRLGDLTAEWSPARLLLGTLQITNLELNGLVASRRPADGGSSEEPDWPELPLAIAIDRFELHDALLEPPLFGERIAFSADGEVGLEERSRAHARLRVTRSGGPSGQLQLELELRPGADRSHFGLALEEDAGGVLARALELEGLPAISIQAKAEGPPEDLRGELAMRADGLARVAGSFGIDATAGPAITLDGRAEIAGLMQPPLRELLGGEVEFDGRVVVGDDGLLLQRVRLGHALARLELSGELRGDAVAGDASLKLPDLAPLSELAGVALHGGAELRANFRADDLRRGATAVVSATLSEPLAPGSPALALVGSRVEVDGTLELEAQRQWTLRDLKLSAAGLNLSASGSLGADGGELRADYELTVPRLAALTEWLGAPLTGTLTASGEIAGDPADPGLSARLSSGDLAVDGIALGPAEARLDLANVVTGASGELALSAQYAPVGAVSLTGGIAMEAGDRLRLAPLRVSARDATLAGALDVDLGHGTASGRLAAEQIALSSWSEPAGAALSGSAQLSLELTAGAEQQLRVDAGVWELGLIREGEDGLTVAVIQATARVADLLGAPKAELQIDARDAAGEGLQLEHVVASLALAGPHGARGRLRAQGSAGVPVTLELEADYRGGDRGSHVDLTALEASIAEHVVRLSQPAAISWQDGAATLSGARFAVADGWLTAEGRLDATQIAANVAADRLSLAPLAALVPMARATGSLSGRLTLHGTRADPLGELELETRDAGVEHSRHSAPDPVSAQLHGVWRAGRCELELTLREPTGTAIEARGSVPLRLDAQTLALSVPTREPVDGRLRWSGDLRPLWDRLSPNEDHFSGTGDLALDLAGTVAAPRVDGHLQIDQGHYENVLSGSTLADVKLRLVGDGEKLVLEQLSANDGAKGTLSGRGVVVLLPAQRSSIDLSLEFDDMLLAARDELILRAGGRLELEGTFDRVVLSGAVETGRSELMLAGSLPPDVVELEVDEVDAGTPSTGERERSRGAGNPSILALDVDVVVPGRAFARGLGLDSEWSGKLKISGSANAPKVAGALSPVRGHFALIGKRFTLERGSIRFTGADEIDPLLDLTAEHRASSLTALVVVSGSASSPKVTLTSRPPLPEAEIVSQVLFGTGSSNLTPAQSLQLASAIATYSGVGGAVGVLDSTRRALGLDVINFSESEQNADATRVSVGKYIRDGVYIEVEAGGEQSSHTATTIEVEVLPDVRVQGGTTERGGNQVGVKWKWDY